MVYKDTFWNDSFNAKLKMNGGYKKKTYFCTYLWVSHHHVSGVAVEK